MLQILELIYITIFSGRHIREIEEEDQHGDYERMLAGETPSPNLLDCDVRILPQPTIHSFSGLILADMADGKSCKFPNSELSANNIYKLMLNLLPLADRDRDNNI